MRRKDREITRQDELVRLLEEGKVCRLGLSDQGQPYIVPLNYGYQWTTRGLVLYFHCALEGRKLDIIGRNNRACFEIDMALALHTSDLACEFSMNYESLIGFGVIEIVADLADKTNAMNTIMLHYSDKNKWIFDEKSLSHMQILRLCVESLTGKNHES